MPADDTRPPGHNNGDDTEGADDVILSEQTAALGSRPASPPTTLTPHDLATPYVLDALDLDEREAFEHHLATCEVCQLRVIELEEAALLLPDALVSPPADLPDAFPFLLRDVALETLPMTAEPPLSEDDDDLSAPVSSDVEADPGDGFTPVTADEEPESDSETGIDPPSDEERMVAQESAEAEPATVQTKRSKSKQRDKPEPAALPDAVEYPTRPVRPPGRIRPGDRLPAGAVTQTSASSLRSMQVTPAVVVALALGLVALGLFLWALLLLGRVGDLDDEIGQQNQEITALRQQANATAWTLTPTSSGPPNASGTFFFSLPDQQGALVVRGLNPAPNEWAYQIWFIDDDESTPIAGPTFPVDENGEALIPLTAEVASFDGVAISLEPAAGSPAPTSQVVLQGRLGGAAG
jgi:nitrogen fixation-related uncharacterized protein